MTFDQDLLAFLKEHENEDIAIYSFPVPVLYGVKLELRVGTMIISRIYSYDEIMSPVFRLKKVLDDMYSQLNSEKEDKQ